VGCRFAGTRLVIQCGDLLAQVSAILKRSPLRPGAPLQRKKPIRTKNPARARKRYARNFGDWADVIRDMPCWWCGKRKPSEACHMIPRSRGGDRTVILPGCRTCHDWIDAHPKIRDTYIEVARALYAENANEATHV
jgi:hypothetical protein